MQILFFDTETTGNGDTDRLCQLAVKERGAPEPLVNAMYQPPVPISIDSMVVHHITPKMLTGRPHFTEAPEYARIKKMLESPEAVMVAHNAAFDVTMLAREGVTIGRTICTYKLAHALDPEARVPHYRLQYLRYFLELNIDAPAHDALGDVLVLEALFERLLAKMIEAQGSEAAALTEMINLSARPLLFTTIRFGKHAGKKLETVAQSDPSYLSWLLAEKRKDPVVEADWIYSLEHYLRPTRP